MVGKGFRKIILACAMIIAAFCGSPAHAQNFEAFVDSGDISVGQTVNVKLELTGVRPSGVPDVSQLPQGLKITGQSQESQIAIVNGKQTGSISWIYNILPSREGTYQVPELPIDTESGVFYTRPFKITVKDVGSLPAATEDNSVFMESVLDKDIVYAGQPTILTVKIYSKYQLNNADLKKPVSEGMLIDQIGKPKTSSQIFNGVNHNVVTIDFLITPTKTGRSSIGAAVLTGRITPNGVPKNIGSFMDAFDQSNNASSFVVTPFTVATKPINITVKEPVKNVTPWLVAQQLDVKDEISVNNIVVEGDNINVKAGEPFTRKIMLYALGRFGNSLPDIEKLVHNDSFKIYSDKPVEKGEIKLETGVYSIVGKKAQNFNYIPQKEGDFELPEIKISWWNSDKDVLETSIIPARKIKVTSAVASGTEQPAINKAVSQQVIDNATQVAAIPQPVSPPPAPAQQQANIVQQNAQPSQPVAANSVATEAKPIDKPAIDFETILMWLVGFAVAILVALKMFSNKPQAKTNNEPGLMRRVVTNEIKPKAIKAKEAFTPTSRRVVQDSAPIDIDELNKVSSNNGCSVIIDKGEPSFFANITDEISSSKEASQLLELMQRFAADNMGMKRTSNIIDIAETMVNNYQTNANIVIFAKQVDAYLFAGKPFEIEIAKTGIRKAMQEVISYKPKKAEDQVIKDFDKLNPF